MSRSHAVVDDAPSRRPRSRLSVSAISRVKQLGLFRRQPMHPRQHPGQVLIVDRCGIHIQAVLERGIGSIQHVQHRVWWACAAGGVAVFEHVI